VVVTAARLSLHVLLSILHSSHLKDAPSEALVIRQLLIVSALDE